MRLKALLLIICLPVLLIFPGKSLAAEFSADYDVTYDVHTDGSTYVNQQISLKNLTNQYYVSNFTLTIGSTNISEVSASDSNGAMETNVEKKDNKTAINLKFNQQIAGLGKVQNFNLKFSSTDFSQNIGKTWEINLPKMPSADNIGNYNLTLSVPVSFGDPTSIYPKPKKETQSFDKLSFHYDKKQLESSGISVTFGVIQLFDFNLKYSLENDSLMPILTSVTIPPDNEFQDIFLKSINPIPLNVTIDEDGNFLAWYKLAGRSNQDIVASGSARIYLSPKTKTKVQLSDQQRGQWTKSDKYWESDNVSIRNVLDKILQGNNSTTEQEKARLIYRYVVDTLKYNNKADSSNIDRLGAVTALNNPDQGVCMEFTDLFIALSRAAGIPARELDGYAYSVNKVLRPLSLSKNLLHAWPEYYDSSRGWVMVDPTWENTSGGVDYFNKFDLNHFILATKGISSVSPFVSENINVNISNNDFKIQPNFDINIESAATFWSGFPGVINVTVKNSGTAIVPANKLYFNVQKLNVSQTSPIDMVSIPPYGKSTYIFNVKSGSAFDNLSDNIEVSIGDKTLTKAILIKPIFLLKPAPFVFIASVIVILITYLVILSIHIFRKSQTNKILKSP